MVGDVFDNPRSPNHLHHETCSVDFRSLFCSTTLSNCNVFSSLSFVSSVLSKQQAVDVDDLGEAACDGYFVNAVEHVFSEVLVGCEDLACVHWDDSR